MVYGAYKDLPRKTASDEVSFNNEFAIASNPYYDGYQRGLASVVEYFLDRNLETLQLTKEQELFLRINN